MNILPIVNEDVYESGPHVVRLWANDCSDVSRAKKQDALDLFRVSVSVSAVNHRDLDEIEKFARAILGACKTARKLNRARGL